MNPPTSNSRLGSEFDAFLFEPLGEDRNGLPLSVVSLLGRMDLDPWQEAAILASLPAKAAAEKLATLLAALPDPSLKQADAGKVVTRLIALLPIRPDRDVRSLDMVRVRDMVHPHVLMTAILFAIWTIWLLSTPAGSARHDAPTHADAANASARLTVPLQTAPTTSSK